ncbi:hypothetical protein Q3G72_002375 [Acer saccharum]|nr:hypothetical protein Q3G72_002375 [Acer saccharum]
MAIHNEDCTLVSKRKKTCRDHTSTSKRSKIASQRLGLQQSLCMNVPWLLVLRIHRIGNAATTTTETASKDARTGTALVFFFVHDVERQRSGFPSTL